MKEVVKAEILKLLDVGIIYPISDSKWVSPVQLVPKNYGMIVVKNEHDELIPTRITTGWRVCIDYRKLNIATRKGHFPLPFIDQMLERLAGHSHYCFLHGYSGYNLIPIAPEDQEKTTFTCPFWIFTYKRMPFRLCNAQATFQRCMMNIFSNMVERLIEVQETREGKVPSSLQLPNLCFVIVVYLVDRPAATLRQVLRNLTRTLFCLFHLQLPVDRHRARSTGHIGGGRPVSCRLTGVLYRRSTGQGRGRSAKGRVDRVNCGNPVSGVLFPMF
ncbi:hypothetical protein AAC387_Pa03g1645 [Persea americana]